MSAATLAEIRTKSAIKDYEEQTGVQVSGNARLEEMFAYLSQIYLVHATLGEMRLQDATERLSHDVRRWHCRPLTLVLLALIGLLSACRGTLPSVLAPVVRLPRGGLQFVARGNRRTHPRVFHSERS